MERDKEEADDVPDRSSTGTRLEVSVGAEKMGDTLGSGGEIILDRLEVERLEICRVWGPTGKDGDRSRGVIFKRGWRG